MHSLHPPTLDFYQPTEHTFLLEPMIHNEKDQVCIFSDIELHHSKNKRWRTWVSARFLACPARGCVWVFWWKTGPFIAFILVSTCDRYTANQKQILEFSFKQLSQCCCGGLVGLHLIWNRPVVFHITIFHAHLHLLDTVTSLCLMVFLLPNG